ncbi:Rieske 2Fe-2S domain-containing protein [Sulfurospirillum sp.]|uniref:Rieske 2Fe-2S domain-containing protein n=1 Tax=Sulfurospirillum sp. TaxID=2053622 RepID=UPI002FDD2A5F
MDRNRRLVNYSLIALVGTGAYFSIDTMFKSLEPPKKARLDAATFIDAESLPLNEVSFFTWQKKPLFVLKKDASLIHDAKRDVLIGEYYYTIMVGICTHLGCIPKYETPSKMFVCPCHSGHFDYNGNPIKGPVTKALLIPPFKIQNQTIIVGEVGEAYLNLMESSKA